MIAPLQAAAALLILIGTGVDPRAHAAHPEEVSESSPHGNGLGDYAPVQGLPVEQQGPSHDETSPENVDGSYDEAEVLQDPLQDEGSAVEDAAKAYTEGPTPKLPKIYGLKTLLFGLLVAVLLLYLTVLSAEENIHGKGKGLFATDKKGLKGLADISKKLGKHAVMPFLSPDQAESHFYIGALVFMLSGSYELLASLMRRRQARKGYAVAMHPPLRGTTLFYVGLLLGIAAFVGVYASIHMAAIGVAHIAFSIMMAAALLFLGSLLSSFW